MISRIEGGRFSWIVLVQTAKEACMEWLKLPLQNKTHSFPRQQVVEKEGLDWNAGLLHPSTMGNART